MRLVKFRFNIEGEICDMTLSEITESIQFGNDIFQFLVGQFTGLFDKNGQEIYEGDIIKFEYNIGGEVIGEIMWSKGGYYVVKTTDEKWNQKVIPYPVEVEIITKNTNVIEN
jgi:uncharacterized phage protein (TIGR01671 family)